jgi:ferredoxin
MPHVTLTPPDDSTRDLDAASGTSVMLQRTAAERRPESRLRCQLQLDASLDRLIVRIPEKQQ